MHSPLEIAKNYIEVGTHKVNLSVFKMILLGFFAGMAMVLIAGSELFTSFWPVMLFVLCGFEHSIADMYFGMSALFTSAEYGIGAEGLTWFNFLFKNLLPVTIGNIIGGTGIVGFGYWLIYLHHTPLSATTNEEEQSEIDIAEEY